MIKLNFTEKDYEHIVKFGYSVGIHNEGFPEYPLSPEELFKNLGPSPVTFFVSGGLDSSILLFLWLKVNGDKDVKLITTPNEDDAYYVSIIEKQTGLKARNIIDQPDLIDCMRAQGSPMDLGSMQKNYVLFQNTETDLVITGDGADEIFGGYNRHRFYDTHETDIKEELLYYHLPRILNMAEHFGKRVLCPYLYYLNAKSVFKPGKEWLKEVYGYLLPDEILRREKIPLKSPDAKEGIPYRAKLVNSWKDLQ